MIDIQTARQAVAAAVASAGIDCTAYAPDAPVPPCGWIDDIEAVMNDTFCVSARMAMSVVLVEQRNDRVEGLRNLEAALPAVLTALTDVQGLVVTEIRSGTAQIGGQEMPAVTVSVRADI